MNFRHILDTGQRRQATRSPRTNSQDDDDDEEARAPDEDHGEHREADVAGLVEVAADAQWIVDSMNSCRDLRTCLVM